MINGGRDPNSGFLASLHQLPSVLHSGRGFSHSASKEAPPIYVYIELIHFAVQQKLTHHCKAIILQERCKKTKQKTKRPSHQKPLVIKLNFFKPQNGLTSLLPNENQELPESYPFPAELTLSGRTYEYSVSSRILSAHIPLRTALDGAAQRERPCPPEPYSRCG